MARSLRRCALFQFGVGFAFVVLAGVVVIGAIVRSLLALSAVVLCPSP